MNLLNNEQKMLDILFAKRNRSYGAYAIRSAYGSTIFRSLFIVVFTVATSAGLAFWLKESHSLPIDPIVVKQDPNIHETPVDMEPKKEEVKQAKSEAGKPKTDATATLINDKKVDSTKQVVNTEITPANTNTTAGTGTDTGTTTIASNTATNTGIPTGTVSTSDLDEFPEFEGGHGALLAFVKRHLVYPGMAVEEGRQGTLYAKFVVDETGKVSNIFLQNNLGYGLDDEAMRVLKMIPKFKSPGKVKGQPVKTYYQIPIKFKLG